MIEIFPDLYLFWFGFAFHFLLVCYLVMSYFSFLGGVLLFLFGFALNACFFVCLILHFNVANADFLGDCLWFFCLFFYFAFLIFLMTFLM